MPFIINTDRKELIEYAINWLIFQHTPNSKARNKKQKKCNQNETESPSRIDLRRRIGKRSLCVVLSSECWW